MLPPKLERDQDYEANFYDWLLNGRADCIQTIREWYERTFGRGTGDEVDVIITDKYANFILYELPQQTDDLRFLSDYFKNIISEIGYTAYASDIRSAPHPQSSQHFIERHYLKPAFVKDRENYKLPVLYGNVAVETFVADGQPYLLKVTCTYYSERSREKDKSLHELMGILLRS